MKESKTAGPEVIQAFDKVVATLEEDQKKMAEIGKRIVSHKRFYSYSLLLYCSDLITCLLSRQLPCHLPLMYPIPSLLKPGKW